MEFNLQKLLKDNPEKIILSNKSDSSYIYRKIVIERSVVKSKPCFQITRYTEKQAFQENLDDEHTIICIEETFPEKMVQASFIYANEERNFKYTKKGKLLSNINKKKQQKNTDNDNETAMESTLQSGKLTHNRKKNYIINEGDVVPPLVDMGIFTKDGKVVNSMYDKFKQINRFVEIVDDVVKEYNRDEIYIIDFGCGKSYLTFILYYYLVYIKQIKAHITGLDLKEDVIRKCNAAAKKYGYENLLFAVGDINGYKTDAPVDMVVTLHACDTATDFALANAVNWNARYILSVPCCQHELNGQISSDTLAPIMNYGILKERMSAIATDAIRGNVLTYCGYKTQVMEFVDMAHSPKNLLIRAVKTNVSREKRERAISEVREMCGTLNVSPTIVSLLGDRK